MSQQERVVDQFTRQAVTFASAKQIQDQDALNLLLSASGAGASDRTLDVACGPGIVVCHFAAVVRSATGIDLTPAMIDQAKTLQREKGLSNVAWHVGDVTSLPFENESFSVVTSRYAFHHLEQPDVVLSEMIRVCEVGGKVVLMDLCAADDEVQARNFNRMERLRDPSHIRALSLTELCRLFGNAGLPQPSLDFCTMTVRLDQLLTASFPNAGDASEVERLVCASLADNNMGVQTRIEREKVVFSYPIAVLSARSVTPSSRPAT